MIAFEVVDMTCGYCAHRITEAVMALDSGAKVEVAIGSRLVRIANAERSESELRIAIRDAGYTPRPVSPAATTTAATGPRKCCCA